MRAGVKYCGGCRASYDRKAEAELAEKAAPGVSFSGAVEGGRYDALLAVCGCGSRCADLSPYDADRIIYISEPGGAAEAAEAITATTEGKE